MNSNFEKFFPIYSIEKDLIITKSGDISLVFKFKLPQIFSLDKDDMEQINIVFDKMIRSLPEDSILHKQDYFFVDELTEPVSSKGDILSKSDNMFYYEKPTLSHECYLIISKDSKNKINLTQNTDKYNTYLNSISKFINDIEISIGLLGRLDFFEIRRLNNDEIIHLLENYFSLSKKGDNKLKDISFNKKLQVDNKIGEMYAITSNNELPISIDSNIRSKEYSTQRTDFFLPFMQPICLGLECNHIYNQIIYVQNTDKFYKSIKLKMNNFKSLAVLSKENLLYYESLENLIEESIEKELVFVKQNFNILIWDEDEDRLKKHQNKLENTFRDLNILPYHIKYSIKDMYFSNCPGAAKKVPEEMRFIGISEQVSALMNFESYYESYKDGVLLCDRKNEAPIRIDLWDEPVKRGQIVNRNRLIFGPSGTGKSFLVNHMASQYYEQGHHIVMIDIGDSYKKLCTLVGGQYYTYDFDAPLEFNPFYFFGNIDVDKKEFLTALIMFLWKGDTAFIREEKQIVSLYIDAFYSKIKNDQSIYPKFSTFYEFVMENRVEYNEEKYFDKLSFDLSLREFYDGKYRHVLNADKPVDLVNERFIVFEMDNIKDHPILFPLVTMLCIDVIMEKIRMLKGIKKSIFIDECWKPISQGDMADFIKYMYKTVRKHYGEIAIATQDLEDILNTEAGPAMINNSDTQILLSHKKKMASKDKFQAHLSFTNSDLEKLFSTDKHEVFIKVGGHSNVYKISVSKERYACYTSNANENSFIFSRYRKHKNIKLAFNEFINEYK